jgi:hypothetical protein
MTNPTGGPKTQAGKEVARWNAPVTLGEVQASEALLYVLFYVLGHLRVAPAPPIVQSLGEA